MQLLRRSRRSSNHATQINTPEQVQDATIPRQGPIPPELLRTMSDDTLAGSILPPNNLPDGSMRVPSQIRRTISNGSTTTYTSRAETFVDLVLGHSFSEYNEIRTLPIVSTLFQKGLYIFPSEEALNLYKKNNRNIDSELRKKGLGMPILQFSSPMLNTFKKGSPNIVIYKFKASSTDKSTKSSISEPVENKLEFCKVYYKYLQSKISRYSLHFTPNGQKNDLENETIEMYISSVTPYADLYYKGTRLRWIGTTSIAALSGSGFFKLIKLSDDQPSLVDLVGDDVSEIMEPETMAYRGFSATASSLPPLARYSDRDSSSIPRKRMLRQGNFKVVEVFGSGNKDSILDIPYCSLVITCLALVLRDQEMKKSSGHTKYYETSVLSATTMFA